MAMQKPPAWLEPGSRVEVEIEKPGRLIDPSPKGPAPDA
jgi:hypothetical protein